MRNRGVQDREECPLRQRLSGCSLPSHLSSQMGEVCKLLFFLGFLAHKESHIPMKEETGLRVFFNIPH